MSYENLFSNDDDDDNVQPEKAREEDTLLGSFFQSIYSPPPSKFTSSMNISDEKNQNVKASLPKKCFASSSMITIESDGNKNDRSNQQ